MRKNNYLFDEAINFIASIWVELKEEFNIEGSLLVMTPSDYLKEYFENNHLEVDVKNDESIVVLNISNIIKDQCDYIGRITWSEMYIEENQQSLPELTSHRIIINKEYLAYSILHLSDNMDRWKQCMKIAIRHEIGHIIDGLNINKRFNSYKDYVDSESEYCQNEHELYLIKDQIGVKEYFNQYFSLPKEKIANGYVGLTIKDMYDNRFYNDI